MNVNHTWLEAIAYHPHRTRRIDPKTGEIKGGKFIRIDWELICSPAWLGLSRVAKLLYPYLLNRWESDSQLGTVREGWTTFSPEHCERFGVSVKRETIYRVMEEYAQRGLIEYGRMGRGRGRKNQFRLSNKWMENTPESPEALDLKKSLKRGKSKARTCISKGTSQLPPSGDIRSLSEYLSEEEISNSSTKLELAEYPVKAKGGEASLVVADLEPLRQAVDETALARALMIALGDGEYDETVDAIATWIKRIGLEESRDILTLGLSQGIWVSLVEVYQCLKNRSESHDAPVPAPGRAARIERDCAISTQTTSKTYSETAPLPRRGRLRADRPRPWTAPQSSHVAECKGGI